MKFLIDADVLIRAKNDYYGFDICPGFWKWLLIKHAEGLLFSIDKVKDDINQGKDELKKWANSDAAKGFFLETGDDTASNLVKIGAALEQVGIENKARAKIDKFMKDSDSYLVAHAMAIGCGVITLEKGGINHREKIKIPGVCELLNVPHKTSIFDLLHADKPLFNFPYNKVSDVTVEYTTEEAANQYPPN